MKALSSIFLFFFFCLATLFAQENTKDTVKRNVPDLEKWTEQQVVQWEDSVRRSLYPEPDIITLPKLQAQTLKSIPRVKAASLAFTNNHVPDSLPIDFTKDVGEIVMSSSTSSNGSKIYNIPLDMSPGRQNFQPELSITYNSLGGNGTMGIGWSIGGLSSISRIPRSIYYDNLSSGVTLAKTDAFVLDGTRLIKLSETSSQIVYETEQEQIKVTAFLNGNIIMYFEVSYPNGNKGIFGFTTNTTNQVTYPITSLTDLRSNNINYSYTSSNNRYYINTITYTGASVTFSYLTSRPDPVVNYEGGQKSTDNRLLQKIECKSGGTTFRSYDFTYQTQTIQNVSALTQIGSTATGKSLNPLKFYYGEGNTAYSYTKAETQLLEWYNFTQPGQLILSKGKFDYGTDDDGLISLPNKNPYWQHYRSSGLFRHSQNRYDNYYSGTEKIFLYAGLSESFATPMPNLVTEAGFTDVFTANVDGKYEEEVIKVNNTVSGSDDRLQFKVYSVNLYTGLSLKYTRVFNFPTVLTDADGGKSIHPKMHLTGDFNGDGKIEVFSVSNANPFGWNVQGRCYLFDLETGSKLYDGVSFQMYRQFVGTNQGDPQAAAQNSDRLYAMDYDGDGKTDVCLINSNGTFIYTFDINGSAYTLRQVSHYTGLQKETTGGRQLLVGEFNGDGKPDFLLTTQSSDSDWAVFYSMGNGQFEKTFQTVTTKTNISEFFLQDLNSDGLTDIIEKYGSSGFFTYLTKPGMSYYTDSYSTFDYSGSIPVPTNINSRNYFHQLVALKDGKVTRYSYPRNDTKEKQLTGAVNSLGVVDKNYYLMLNESSNYYTKGSGAVYPFENFQGPFSVVMGGELFVNGQKTEDREYHYENAVIHKQGRGFCGFGRITSIDNIRSRMYTQDYDPYNFGILKIDDSPTAKTTNTWSVSVQSNKIAKIRLTNQSILNKLTSQTRTSTYIHDTYGNVTKATANYGTGLSTITDQSFYNSLSGSVYLIGQPLTKVVTNTRAGQTWIDKESFTYNTVRLPLTRIIYTGTSGDQKTGETRWTYDTYGNILSEKSAPYNVSEFLGNTYTYDATGRFIATSTNAMSQVTTYSNYDSYGNPRTVKDHKNRTTTNNFDVWGRLTSSQYPDATTESMTLAWGGAGLYTASKNATGQPAIITHNDALNREVRSGNQRFDGQWQFVDTEYDTFGRANRTSLPFRGTSATLWDTYAYDNYDRPTALTEASGRTSSWSYAGLSTTETKNGIATTKTLDASGVLVTAADPGGTISYISRPDGQYSSITAPGGGVTTFQYDVFGRKTVVSNPSSGQQTTAYSYTTAGVLTLTETNPKGTVVSIYDKYGRVSSVQRQTEFTTTYTYNTDGLLTNETATNGTSKIFTYDGFDRILTERENVPDSKWMQKTYAYSGGNISSVQYSAQSGVLGTENFTYAYGHNTEIKLNGTTSIWKLTAENALGQQTAAITGVMNRNYTYNNFGKPTGRTAGSIQNFTYNFDVQKSNLLSRIDNKHAKTEAFVYDNLNRLTSAAGKVITYTANGNITRIQGVGTLAYENTAKPHQVTLLTPEGTAVPLRAQSITYTSSQRPSSIIENTVNASLTYNSDGNRVKMHVVNGTTPILTRYYIGGQYELDATTNTERLYLGGDAYTAPAVYVKEAGIWKIYYICRDYLGSITHIANADGSLKQELSYDAWGRLRNPSTQVAYVPGSEPTLFLGRGYTGHEYLPWFGLINMNARLYDPALGRFLSPDPYVQMPDFSQNFNRYSYALNNPLVYIDPDGEFIHIIVGAIIGGAINLTVKIVQGKVHNVWDGVAAFGIGAAGGAVVAATGGAALSATGLTATSVLGGAVSGITGFATGGVVQNVGNHLYFGDPLMSGKEFALGLAASAVTGGALGGVANKIWGKGTNFWTGKNGKITVGYPKYEGYEDEAGNLIKNKPSTLPDYPAENAQTATQRARELGQQGEQAVGLSGPKTSIQINGRTRIPDNLNFTDKILVEVKNVKSLSFTQQLRDFSDYAQQKGLDFILYTRPNTVLTQPLKDAINNKLIIHKFIP